MAIVAVFGAVLVVAFLASGALDGGRTSSQRPPERFVYLRDGSKLTLVEGSQVADSVWSLEAGSALVVESLEPVRQDQIFVGVCCEPADGRQLLIDIETGRVEFFPLTVRFPSTDGIGEVVATGGPSVRLENLGAFLAYEDGVGVVAPGPTVHVAVGDEALRPVLLPMDRVAVVDDGTLTIINFDGQVLAEQPAGQIRNVVYDRRNDVLVALVGTDTVRLLSPNTLAVLDEWRLERDATSIDVAEGWLLSSNFDGSLTASRIDSPESEPVLLVESGGGVASWLPSS